MTNNLKSIRKSRGLVLWHLAAISKVNPSLISAIERHDYQPSREVQARLAAALSVEIAEIWPFENKTTEVMTI